MKTKRAGLLLSATLAASIVGISLTPTSAHAASKTAAITGTVVDNLGDRVDGIKVTARASSGRTYSAFTDKKGRYFLKGLKPGSYGVKYTDPKGVFPGGEAPGAFHYNSEWYSDELTFAKSTKFRLSAGEKKTGVRGVISIGATISGKVTVDGRPGKASDRLVLTTTRLGKVVSSRSVDAEFHIGELDGNYRLQLSSESDAFTPIDVVDPRDGNTVFGVNGVEKVTGTTVQIVTTP